MLAASGRDAWRSTTETAGEGDIISGAEDTQQRETGEALLRQPDGVPNELSLHG